MRCLHQNDTTMSKIAAEQTIISQLVNLQVRHDVTLFNKEQM